MTHSLGTAGQTAPARRGSPPPCSLETSFVDEAYDLGRKSARWDVSCEQLSPGSFSGRVCELWLPSIQVVQESCNQAFLESGQSWETSYTFAVFASCGGTGRYFGGPLYPNQVCTLNSEDEIDIRSPEGFERTSVTIGTGVLDRYLSQHETEALKSRFAHGSVSTARGAADSLRHSLIAVLGTVGASPGLLSLKQTRKTLEESVVSAVLDNVISPNVDVSGDRPGFVKDACIVRCAREYIVAHMDEPITVVDLCCHVNVSRRTLQYCFEKLLDVSPSTYLRLLRLNGAHRDLKLADPAESDVTGIATRWGFWHLARFSMYYRRLFGEYPSETLRRTRRRQ